MYGMMCALLASAIWVTVATYWELGVSTTHSIVGAIVAFTLVGIEYVVLPSLPP